MNIARNAKLLPAAVVIAGAIVFCAPRATASSGGAKSIFDNLDASVIEEYTSLAKKPSNIDYKITQTSFHAGGKGGARFFHTDTLNKIKKDSPTRKFSTDVRAKEYGVIAATRFASLPRQTFEFGISRKEVHTSTYNDYTWMPAASAWNVDIVGQAEVYSTPIYFNYKYALSPSTTLALALTSQNVKLDTPGNLSVRTKVYALAASHKAGPMEYNLSISRLKASSLSGNTHIKAGASREITRNVSATLTAGMYTHGAPTAGGVFSPVGEQFVFSYIGGEAAFDPVYTNKIGYVSLGINLHTK